VSGYANEALGYVQCDWRSSERCRYPGSLSSNPGPGGPWYCRAHFDCRDPIAGADIVQASMDYRHSDPVQRRAEDQVRADAYCANLGLHTVEEKRAWLRENIAKIGKRIQQPATREPGEDSEEVAA